MTYRSELPPNVVFDPVEHRFERFGERVPAVTEILRDVGLSVDYGHVAPWVLERAAWRGRVIHQAIHYALDDDLDWASLNADVRPLVERAMELLADVRFVPWQVEEPVYSESWRYAGIPDAWGLALDRPAIMEWKTGESGAAGLQTALYRMAKLEMLRRASEQPLPREVMMAKRWLVDLAGVYPRLVELSEPDDEAIALAAVRIYYAKRR